MFSITPYNASAHICGTPNQEWTPCRVIGIDASGDEPCYVVEVRTSGGAFYIDRADIIRKPPPMAG